MHSSIWKSLVLILAIAASLVLPTVAMATNGHQDHRGACARSTTSISKGVGDIRYNGVATSHAKSIGIHAFDGSVIKQLKEKLTIGEIAVGVVTHNTGCDGHGGTFPAGKRSLGKGEKVAVKVPAKYGKDACGLKHHGCHRVKIKVTVVFPVSCWNKNRKAVIWVYIWVKKAHHKGGKKKRCKCQPKKAPVDQDNKQNVGGTANCNSTNSGNVSGPGAVQGSCNNVNVNCNGTGSCSPSTWQTTNTYEECVNRGAGWSWQNNVCTNTQTGCDSCQPPCGCNPPPNPPECTNLSLTGNGTKTGQYGTGLGVTATVTYQSGDDTFETASFTATGPNNYSSTKTGSATSVDFLFPRSGSYVVRVTLNFAKAKNVTSVSCQKTITVKLVCPSGSTSNDDESDCVKDGSSTPPDTTSGGGGTTDPNPPSSGGSSQCVWDHAGSYNGHTHASGESVSQEDMNANGGTPPPDTSCS